MGQGAMLLTLLLGLTRAQQYQVVGPRLIRPNTNFLIAVTVGDTGGELQEIEARILGRTEGGRDVEITGGSRVPPGETQMVRLNIGELGQGEYRLEVKGIKPIEFRETTPLEYKHKGYSVFIQTDKAIYKPGNEVKFRVVVLSPQLKPSVTGSIDVRMKDGAGNLIRSWARVFTTKGVWAASLELADQPVLGNWNIEVDVNGQIFSKDFQVAEYILPKFQVDIDLPTYSTYSETVTATIKANYALGSPVKGKATVAVWPRAKSGQLQPIFSEPLRQVIDISGKVDVEFNLAKELRLNDDYSKEIVFDVVVEEDRTQRRQNNTNSLNLYKYPYKLELVKTADAFKPGMPYTCFLKLTYQDGKPVKDDLNPVSVKSGFGDDPSKYESAEYPVPEDGIIRLAFVAPKDPSMTVLGIEAQYRDLQQWFSTVQRSKSSSDNFIQARLATDSPTVGRNIKLTVTSSEPVTTFNYVVLGRGNLLWAATVDGNGGTKNDITMQAMRDMSPSARVVISYTRDDGEIVADAIDFEVNGFLTNSLDIRMDKAQSFPGPGQTVDIELRAKPNSFIGVLAVDRSVRDLKSGHDLLKSDLLSEIQTYDAGSQPGFFPWVQSLRAGQGSLYWYTGAKSSKQAYDQAGLFCLSSGYLTKPVEQTPTQDEGVNRPIGRPILPPGASTVRPDQGPGVPFESATRPPLAGPYAFSRIPRPIDDLPKIFLRKDLPQTWLFTNTTTNSEGNALMTVPVPELTNTTWVVSGFAINLLDGIGVSENLAQLELFQPFYVLSNLPYSVRVGETVAVEMVVFNYLSKEISAEVTLENPNGDGFVFGSPNPNEIEGSEIALIELHRTKRVTIRPGGRTSVSFIITPQKVGNLELKITAKSSFGQDILNEKLKVEAEGETMYKTSANFVDLTNKGEMELTIPVEIPKHAVPKSTKVSVSAVPDPVGPAINNLRNLFEFPQGCGEQNLATLLPGVLLLNYVAKIQRSSASLVLSTQKLMELGYQKQLAYKHGDGSFSPFGKSDLQGTVWLTSQTAGTLQGLSKFIDVDASVIEKALTWLVDRQDPNDGSFKETGAISHPVQANPVTLTAFTVLGFLDNKRNLTATLRNTMNKAIDYIAQNWDTVSHPYDLAVVTYALYLSVHPARDQAWSVLDSLSTEKDEKKYWAVPVPEDEDGNPWTKEPNSVNIETTAYALLCMVMRKEIKSSIPVVHWLFSQQNSNGGFASTSDTYVALRALTEFSKEFEIEYRNTDMSIQYAFQGTVKRFKVTTESATTMQKRILPDETREVKIRATGNGLAVIEVGWQYNLNVTAAWPSFVVNPMVTKLSDSNHMQVTVCAHFIEKTNTTGSNMAVMEVNLPSGFTVNPDSLPALRRYKGVKRVDREKRDTKVIIYFDSLSKKEVCPTIEAFRTHRVANQKPAPVLVYDYYDQSRRARSFYDIVPATLCDICEEEDCPDDGCPTRPRFPNFGSYAFREAYYAEDSSAPSTLFSSSLLLLLVPCLLLRVPQA